MKYVFAILALLMSLQASAQLSVGSAGMTVLSGTPVAVDGLSLTPAATLSLANNAIQKNTSAVMGSLSSISRVYQFAAPILFSGSIGINYLPTELNGYGESSLQLAYAPAASTNLTITSTSTVDATNHYLINTLTSQPLYMVTASALPDLTPVMYALPSTQYGTTNFSVVVDVFELNVAPTSGVVTVYITKDPLVSLSFNGTSTFVGGRMVQNGNWLFDGVSNENVYILTSKQALGAGDLTSFGLTGALRPGNTRGSLTITAVLASNRGQELRITNNADADKIDYFNK